MAALVQLYRGGAAQRAGALGDRARHEGDRRHGRRALVADLDGERIGLEAQLDEGALRRRMAMDVGETLADDLVGLGGDAVGERRALVGAELDVDTVVVAV